MKKLMTSISFLIGSITSIPSHALRCDDDSWSVRGCAVMSEEVNAFETYLGKCSQAESDRGCITQRTHPLDGHEYYCSSPTLHNSFKNSDGTLFQNTIETPNSCGPGLCYYGKLGGGCQPC